jgi:hypothetical protein
MICSCPGILGMPAGKTCHRPVCVQVYSHRAQKINPGFIFFSLFPRNDFDMLCTASTFAESLDDSTSHRGNGFCALLQDSVLSGEANPRLWLHFQIDMVD